MPRAKARKALVTQRQVAENATKVACEPYYGLYTYGNRQTRDHLVADLAKKLNPEGLVTTKWQTKVERHLRTHTIESYTGFRAFNLRKYTGKAAFLRMYALQITEETKQTVKPEDKGYLAAWNKAADMMYAQLKEKMPEEFHWLDEVAKQWEEMGTPLELAQENRRKGASACINKMIDYLDRRFALSVVMMTGCLNIDNDSSEVAIYERAVTSDRHRIANFSQAFDLRNNDIYKHQWRTYNYLAFGGKANDCLSREVARKMELPTSDELSREFIPSFDSDGNIIVPDLPYPKGKPTTVYKLRKTVARCVLNTVFQLAMGTWRSFPMTKFESLSMETQREWLAPGSLPELVTTANGQLPMLIQDVEKMPKAFIDAAFDHWRDNQLKGQPALIIVGVPESVLKRSERNVADVRTARRNKNPPPNQPSPTISWESVEMFDSLSPLRTSVTPPPFSPPIEVEEDESMILDFSESSLTPGPKAVFDLPTDVSPSDLPPIVPPFGLDARNWTFPMDLDSDDDMELEFTMDGEEMDGEEMELDFRDTPNASSLETTDVRNRVAPFDLENLHSSNLEVPTPLSGTRTHQFQRATSQLLDDQSYRLPSPMTAAKSLNIESTGLPPVFLADGVPAPRSMRNRTVVRARDRLPELVSSTLTPTRRARHNQSDVRELTSLLLPVGPTQKAKPKARFKGSSSKETLSEGTSLQDDPYNRSKRRRT